MKAHIDPSLKMLHLRNTKTIETVNEGQRPKLFDYLLAIY